jgi:hypothetical protein
MNSIQALNACTTIVPAHTARGDPAMGIFDKIRKTLSAPVSGSSGSYNHWFYVRCTRCDETLVGRVDMRNELSRRDDANGFFVRKRLIGNKRCFNPVDVVLYFDANRQITEREIEGGEFIRADEHEPDESTQE